MLGKTHIADTPEKIDRDFYLETLSPDERMQYIKSNTLISKIPVNSSVRNKNKNPISQNNEADLFERSEHDIT